ncbi:MAG TPA: DUF948 domain-containing protein [Candidatus Limnocylindria bacterium]|nr:DUF948 domain-containing protein [Candidatus Limnocylindria bacterium]
MYSWTQPVLVACAVALTVALVLMLLAVKRTAQRTDAVLRIVEEELRPLIGQAHALTDEVRALTREASLEVKRVGEVTERVNRVAEGVQRMVSALAALTRAGQVIGMVAALKKGVDVFVQRMSKDQGETHG